MAGTPSDYSASGLPGKKDENYEKQAARQIKQEGLLAEQAANINYEYNEMAAENAFYRQNQMYETTKEHESYEYRRKQMEDAGLSVGLMYSGGATGGGSGTIGQVPEGKGASGVQSGHAATTAEMQLANQNKMALGMQLLKLSSEIDLNKSVAESNKAEAGLKTEQSKTESESRNVKIATLWANGLGQWYDATQKHVHATMNPNKEWTADYAHNVFGQITYKNEGGWNAEKAAGLLQTYADTNNMNMQAKYANEKAKAIWNELLIAAANADAHKMEAAAKEMEALTRQEALKWETGETITWKTWYNMGIDVLGMGLDLFGAVKGTKWLPQRIDFEKPTGEAPKPIPGF